MSTNDSSGNAQTALVTGAARLDGEAPGPSHGVDVDANGNGLLRDSRLYQLVRQYGRVRERTLRIAFLKPGAEAYVFTFG